MHRCDARVKVALLAVYSVALFFVDTWVGMGAAAALFLGVLATSRIAARRVFGLVAPVYVLVALTLLFNMFVFATPELVAQSRDALAQGNALAGVYPLVGTFSLTVPGFTRGAFFGARILLLVFASLIVCFTSTSTELTDALRSFLAPLGRLKAPVDDIAAVFSIALRFIPVTADEFCRVRDAQWSRGSRFSEGSLRQRLKAWQTVLVPLFVGLFRRADVLAQAMDARCYGATPSRSSLSGATLTPASVAALVVGCALCVALGAFL